MHFGGSRLCSGFLLKRYNNVRLGAGNTVAEIRPNAVGICFVVSMSIILPKGKPDRA